jgi:DNA (cytosine-5)-methyltransferase 1
MSHKTKTHASLFSGFGAADLAATWMGWNNAFWCEIDAFPRTVLSYWFPKSIGYADIRKTDFTEWRGEIDVLTGGFPCQPFSVAGQRKGADDDRYLWPEMLRAIREINPTWVVGENVGGIVSMVQPGCEVKMESQTSLFETDYTEEVDEQEYVIETVCNSLEQEGYSVQPIIVPACAVEAPHKRDRIFFIAYRANSGTKGLQRERQNRVSESQPTANTNFNDAIRSGHAEVGCKEAVGQKQNGKRKRLRTILERAREERFTANPDRNGRRQVHNQTEYKQSEWNRTNRFGYEWNASYSNGITSYLSGFCSKRVSQFKASEIRFDPNAYHQRFAEQCVRSESGKQGFCSRLYYELTTKRDWENFPTQPPVCRGNDGLPFDVERLSVSYSAWCTGAIKGYGNAIVPQVIFEIFKAIESV